MCNVCTALQAKNFDASFSDPRIYSGLVKSFLPDEVDLRKMRDRSHVHNIYLLS